MVAERGLEALLLLGGTMRLSRLVVTDDVGFWFIRQPAHHWVSNHVDFKVGSDDIDTNWRVKLYSGLDCPFCVGQWLAFGNVALYAITRNHPRLRAGWLFVMAGLTLNEVAGHLGSRLGDTSTDSD